MAIVEVLTVEEHNARVEGRAAPPQVGKRYRFTPKAPEAWQGIRRDKDGYIRGKLYQIIGNRAYVEVRNEQGFNKLRFLPVERLEAIP